MINIPHYDVERAVGQHRKKISKIQQRRLKRKKEAEKQARQLALAKQAQQDQDLDALNRALRPATQTSRQDQGEHA